MAEIAVRRDLEVEVVAAPDPLRPLDGADEDLVLRLRRREGPEVVLAGESGRGGGRARPRRAAAGSHQLRRTSNGDGVERVKSR